MKLYHLYALVPLILVAGPTNSRTNPTDTDLYLSCSADNDLYQVLTANGVRCLRFKTPEEAVDRVPAEGAVLLLADGYPDAPTPISPSVYATAAQKNTKMYVEFPSELPGVSLGKIRTAGLERGVVTSGIFGKTLKPNDLVLIHGCRYVEVSASNSYIVLGKVAGFDSAVYGLNGVTTHPVLFRHPSNANLMVSTTKLSQFVTGRYVPMQAWQTIWKTILNQLSPTTILPTLSWNPTVRPAYTASESPPGDAQRQAILRSIQWHYQAKMLIHPDWLAEYKKREGKLGPKPDARWPVGDGKLGLLEGLWSEIDYDRGQACGVPDPDSGFEYGSS